MSNAKQTLRIIVRGAVLIIPYYVMILACSTSEAIERGFNWLEERIWP